MDASPDTAEPFSNELEAWLRSDQTKTLGALGDLFEEKGFAAAILLLMFVPALPLPTGGISHLFEAITVVLAAQMVLGRRRIWLPERWIRRVERISRPRGTRLFALRSIRRLLGLLLIVFAVGAALAPPFSGLDTLPAMGAVAVCLSIILEDVVVLAIGTVLGAVGIALILTVGAALVGLLQRFV